MTLYKRSESVDAARRRVTRGLLHGAVDNLMDLPSEHPVIERSFKLLSEFMMRRAEEIAEDRGA